MGVTDQTSSVLSAQNFPSSLQYTDPFLLSEAFSLKKKTTILLMRDNSAVLE